MFRHGISTLVVTLGALAAPYVMAADPCQPVFEALTKVAATPSHSYTTKTAINGGEPAESETIFVNGQKYIRARGKWMRIPVTRRMFLSRRKKKRRKASQLVNSFEANL